MKKSIMFISAIDIPLTYLFDITVDHNGTIATITYIENDGHVVRTGGMESDKLYNIDKIEVGI